MYVPSLWVVFRMKYSGCRSSRNSHTIIIERHWPVHKVQVDVFAIEGLQRLFKCFADTVPIMRPIESVVSQILVMFVEQDEL